MQRFLPRFVLIIALVVALPALDGPGGRPGGVASAFGESVPEGVELLLPRGGIPAVFEPKFVAADDAHVPDDAWVLGVVINGEAHAYSLNLLNSHEIVNDRFGDIPVAAVW